MLTERDEILIQRCVDGELRSNDRQELLARLDSLPDGWKTLACTYIEEQLFADAARDSLQTARPQPSNTSQSLVQANRSQWWFASPVTTLVLSLCVAFLGGLLLSGRFDQSAASSIAATDVNQPNSLSESTRSTPIQPASPATSATTVSTGPEYSMRVEPVGADPVELPVFADIDSFLERFNEYQRRRLQAQNAAASSKPNDIQFVRMQLSDGRIILVPVPRQFQDLQ